MMPLRADRISIHKDPDIEGAFGWMVTCPWCARSGWYRDQRQQFSLWPTHAEAISHAMLHVGVHEVASALSLDYLSFDLFEDKPALFSLITMKRQAWEIPTNTARALIARWT